MNKTQMFEIISKKSGLSEKQVHNVFNTFNEVLIDALCKGEDVAVAGFGKFYVKDRKGARRVNPITKRFYFSKPKKVTSFKAYKKLKLCVN